MELQLLARGTAIAVTQVQVPKALHHVCPCYAMQYQFTIYWPSSWATKGYTSFTFGLKTEEEAREWHRALADALAGLKAGPTYPVAQPSGLAQNLNTTSVPTLAPSRGEGRGVGEGSNGGYELARGDKGVCVREGKV